MLATNPTIQITSTPSQITTKAVKRSGKRFQKARATLVMLAISAATLVYASSSAWLQVQQANATGTQNSFTSTTGQSSNNFSSTQPANSSTTVPSSNGFSSDKNGG
jgi:hypothetical protein